MVSESRIDIYDYLYNLFYNVVTKNVYSMRPPQELTTDDSTNGFIVLVVGDIHDESEFTGNAYAWARCYVEAYVPPISRGRLNYSKYEAFENAINEVIRTATEDNAGTYFIEEGSILSSDADETSNANNSYFTFIKSFIVNIENNNE